MAFFMIVYDRGRGLLVRQEEHGRQSDALAARFAAEHEFSGREEIEVVALTAESEAALRETHARYFLDLKQLADRMG